MRAAAGSARRSRPRHLDAIGELRVLDPGTVHETRQLTGLLPPADRPDPENVLNGIAATAPATACLSPGNGGRSCSEFGWWYADLVTMRNLVLIAAMAAAA